MRDAGIVPSSGSVPWPVKEITVPTRHLNVDAGVSTNAVGAASGVPTVTVTGELVVVATPSLTRTRTWNVPDALYVNVGETPVASSYVPLPSTSHVYVSV